jgi:ribosomal protein S18 acetylase RimI-like enzyme
MAYTGTLGSTARYSIPSAQSWHIRRRVPAQRSLPGQNRCQTRRHSSGHEHTQTTASTKPSFHVDRLKKDAVPAVQKAPLTNAVEVLDPSRLLTDEEIECVAWLRATSFYAYPPERKFAGELHQMMISEEESKSLKALRLRAKLDNDDETVTLVATCDADAVDADAVDERLVYADASGSRRMVVGSLDVHFARALAGEFLIGDSEHAAYLANVCTAEAARRRGVGLALLDRAKALASAREADQILVHTMAVNEIARAFYEKHGFVVEKEETSNVAHYRGRCLDGIEGAGRTVLLGLRLG